jgi:hypothetical protein
LPSLLGLASCNHDFDRSVIVLIIIVVLTVIDALIVTDALAVIEVLIVILSEA